jgi:sorbitol-specific phosphotransferase system component IIA
MAYEIKGGASCVWGVDEEMTAVGTITDVNYDDQIVSENCENQEGAVDGVVIFDGNKSVGFTIVAKISATLPVKGATLTVGSEKYLIQKVGNAKKHKGKNIVTVAAILHDNMTLT